MPAKGVRLNERYENATDSVVYRSTLTGAHAELLKPDSSNENGPLFGKRHIQVFIYFLLIFIAHGIRVNLSVGIVAMTDPTASSNPDVPTYNWTDKSVVLSAFSWGYILPQAGAGWLASTYGPKRFLVATVGVGSLIAAVLPQTAALFGSKGVMANRALQGLTQGFIFPSTHALLAKWVPPSERSRMGTFVYAAGPLGTVVSMLVTGLISSSPYGWPLVFYVYGCAGLLWAIMFAFFGHNTPAYHPSISQKEKLYIEHSLGHAEEKPKMATPWKKILTSKAVWAIFLAQCGYILGYWTFLAETPVYLRHVMNFNIKSNSLLSALPYLVLWMLSFVFSVISDWIVNKKIVSVGVCRKIFNTIGLLVPAIAVVCLGNTGPNEATKAVVLLVIAVGVNSAVYCSLIVNHMDISPNFSGIIMGITNGASHTFGIIAPLLVQFLVTDERDPSQWKVVFYITAVVYVLSSLIFIIFGSGEVQPWNDEGKRKEERGEANL